MLLSICIPLHPSRAPSNLSLLLASVAGRSSTEILIGLWRTSSLPRDSLASICREFGARLIETPLPHVTHVRNRLVQEATGAYILFLDDDVVARADLIDLAKQYAKTSTSLICQGEPCLGYEQENLLSRIEEELYRRRFAASVTTALGCDYIDPRNLLIARAVISSFAFDETLVHAGEGKEMAIRLKESNYTVKYCPDLVVYHKHRTTITGVFVQKWIHGKGKAQRVSRLHEGSGTLFNIIARTMFKHRGYAINSGGWSFAVAVRVYDFVTRMVYVISFGFNLLIMRFKKSEPGAHWTRQRQKESSREK